MPPDYFYSKERLNFFQQSPSLLGSERSGPDLTDVGNRRGDTWNYIHLFNPRAVEPHSIMPAYPWLFKLKKTSDKNDVVVAVPKEFLTDTSYKVVATQRAQYLVKYLMTLKQTKLPNETAPQFLPSSKLKVSKDGTVGGAKGSNMPDGAKLYSSTCQACHQANGKGLPGAFPPLAGSPIVNGDDIETYIKIVLQGYDAREEYGVMPPFAEQLSDEEIAAIINHERSSWGNKAAPIKVEEVKKVRSSIQAVNP
jgi:cytochrome c oxidase cbb3-type subunit 2